jgi:8-oxo-dGTP pyrophosphatase MutT (NUDIX family)
MRWIVHGERVIYDCDWLTLALTDVEVPGDRRFEHHVIRQPNKAAGTIVFDRERGVLLLWRHRFITDTWGWEIPAGRIDPGETAEDAAHRETLEETGWEPGPLRLLTSFHPTNGMSDQTFNIFVAEGATHVGDPTDPSESERVEWVPIEELRRIVQAGEMTDGLSLTGVLFALAFGALD